MKFIYVDTVDEVIEASLVPADHKKAKTKKTNDKAKTATREKKRNVKSIARRR